jgi:glycosyltransferase involved in cell wall biosynthesis
LFILACIPAYNEENRIGKTILDVLQHVDKVIVCDDGSSDNTENEANMYGAYVIKHQKNLGKGAALKSLFEFAKASNADIIVTIDADGQFIPKEIPKLIKPIIEENVNIVVGNRFDDEKEMPKYRKIGNKFLDRITKLAEELNIKDTQSGFRSYSKIAIEKIEFTSTGFGADSEILISAAKNNLKISEEKITVIYNTGGRTSTKNPISHTSEVILSIIEQIALKHPLKYLGISGIILIFTSILFGINLLSVFNETRYFSIPFTFAALGALIIGALLLLMGVLLYSITITKKR